MTQIGSVGGETWQIGGEKWGSRCGQLGIFAGTGNIQAQVLSAASGNWAWLLPVQATVLNSHFKSTPVWGLRWPPLGKLPPSLPLSAWTYFQLGSLYMQTRKQAFSLIGKTAQTGPTVRTIRRLPDVWGCLTLTALQVIWNILFDNFNALFWCPNTSGINAFAQHNWHTFFNWCSILPQKPFPQQSVQSKRYPSCSIMAN